jgi:hypothetical protein
MKTVTISRGYCPNLGDGRDICRFLARVSFLGGAQPNSICALNSEVAARLYFLTRVPHSLGPSCEATVRFVCSRFWLFKPEIFFFSLFSLHQRITLGALSFSPSVYLSGESPFSVLFSGLVFVGSAGSLVFFVKKIICGSLSCGRERG